MGLEPDSEGLGYRKGRRQKCSGKKGIDDCWRKINRFDRFVEGKIQALCSFCRMPGETVHCVFNY